MKVLFVLGKGGVGRSTVSSLLGSHFAKNNHKTLIIQWSFEDQISSFFGRSPTLFHDTQNLAPNLYTLNYSPQETLKEYFADHLKMKIFYDWVIKNKHVQSLLQAAPGLQEMFFLGRIFWLCSLSLEERGWEYDKIIIDCPAMGHGGRLFHVTEEISNLGFPGLLARECERVTGMLQDPKLVSWCLVTLGHRLSWEETRELQSKVESDLKRPPQYIFLNRSLSKIENELSQSQEFKDSFKERIRWEKKIKEDCPQIHSIDDGWIYPNDFFKNLSLDFSL